MNIAQIRQQLKDHTAAIKTATALRQRIVDRIDAVRDEPIESNLDYRQAQVLHQEARVRQLTDELHDADDAVMHVAADAVAFARSVTTSITGATAVDLNPEQWARAGAVQGLLELELDGASIEAIANRLDGAMLTGEPAERYATAVVAESKLKAATGRDDGERGRISQARQMISDIRVDLRPKALDDIAAGARDLLLAASHAESGVAEGQRDRGESAFQLDRGGRTVRIAGDDLTGYRSVDDVEL